MIRLKGFKKIMCIAVAASMIAVTASCTSGGSSAANQSGTSSTAKVNFPEKGKQITMIIDHGIGGSVDSAGRGIAIYLQKYLGVPVVPQNVDGASGRRAREQVFAAKPDGYTILVCAHPSAVIGELSYPDTKYHMKEFVHLGAWTDGDARSIVVKTDSPVKTFKDLMALSDKATSDHLKVAGGGGMGSASSLQIIYLQDKMKMNVDFIPFDSTAEVENSVLGKQVDFGVMPLSAAIRFQQQGDVRILAIHGEQRSSLAPDVPTLDELGYKGVVDEEGNGAYAPPGTPKEIQQAYSEAINKAFSDQEFLNWANKTSSMIKYINCDDFQKKTLQIYDDMSSIQDQLVAWTKGNGK